MLRYLRQRLDSIEDAINWVNDSDVEWWPFVFLRPERHEKLSSTRVALMAVLYGSLIGMMVNVLGSVVVEGFAARVNVMTFPVGISCGFFVLYRSVFAYCWNRRAERQPLRGLPDDC